MRSFSLILAAILGICCLSSGKKSSKHIVSFHAGTNETTDSKRIFEWPLGSGYMYEKAPTVHHQQIASFATFNGDDGGYGVIFRLTTGGRNSLAGAAATQRGKFLLAMLNGEPRSILTIDGLRDDGQLVIWENVRPEDIEVLEKTYPRFE